jgi:hypothetical protein
MRIKIELEDAPPEVNAALADDKGDGCYGTLDLIEGLLLVALRARANQAKADLEEMSEAYTADIRRFSEESVVIEAYRTSLREGRGRPKRRGPLVKLNRAERVSVDA